MENVTHGERADSAISNNGNVDHCWDSCVADCRGEWAVMLPRYHCMEARSAPVYCS